MTAHITIPAGEPVVSYTPVSSSTGPFNVTFPIFADTDLVVLVDGEELDDDEWTFTSTDTRDGGYQAGYITLDVATTERVDIYRDTSRSRTSDYANGPLVMNSLNSDIDRTVARDQDTRLFSDRAIRGPLYEPGLAELPSAADRASKYLAFDASGDPMASDAAVSTAAMSVYFQTLIDAGDKATLQDRLDIDPTAQKNLKDDYGAVGDGATDDTTAFTDFIAAGGGFIPAGTYIVGALTISNRFHVWCDDGATIKQKAATASANWLTFASGAAGSTWIGGIFDGNKANQTFSVSVAMLRISSCNKLKLLPREIANGIVNPITLTTSDEVEISARVRSCNGPVSLAVGDSCEFTFRITGTNNSGLAILQHAFDLSDFTETTASVTVEGQVGDASGTSATMSGITIIRCDNCSFPLLRHIDHAATAVPTLGISLVAGKKNNFGQVIVNKCKTNIELAGLKDSVFASVQIDGEYQTTTAVSSASSIDGVVIHSGGQYTSALSGSVTGADKITFGAVNILRCGTGLRFRNGKIAIGSLSIRGSVTDNIRTEATNATTYFTATAERVGDIVLGAVNLTCAGRAGIMLDEGYDISIGGGVIANNGQDTTQTANNRSGVGMQTSGLKQRLSLGTCIIKDDQSFTKTLGLSYQPGTTDSANRYTFTVMTPGLLDIGQWITLDDVISGPADATGKIVAIDKDEITVEFASAKTFVAVLQSGTGTISSSGTAVTGVGTAFTTEIVGRCWIKADGEYRQVAKVNSNTSLTLVSAFTDPLSADTFERTRCNVIGVPSQQNGVYVDDNCTDINIGDATYDGNVAQDVKMNSSLNSVPGTVAPGKEIILYGSGTFAASTTQNLVSSVPVGYEVLGYRFHVTQSVAGTTGSTIGLALAGGSTQAFSSGLAVTINTKSEGNVVPERLTAATVLRATFSGGADNTPDGVSGTWRAELRVRRASFKAFASV